MADVRLVKRGNKILQDLFRTGVHSIRQISEDEASAKGHYRFLQNERVSEDDIIRNMSGNCKQACKGKYVVCIQDTTEINLYSHKGRIKKDAYIGTTAFHKDKGLGFYIHPSLVLDAVQGTPYGFADVKIWSRSGEFQTKYERHYKSLPIEEKESYKWLEVSQNTADALQGIAAGIVIVQDREGDIYEQFARVPKPGIDLLIRARSNRRLTNKAKLYDYISEGPAQGSYTIPVENCGNRKKRAANIEIRYKEVEIANPARVAEGTPKSLKLWAIEAGESGYSGEDKICWRLLTTIPIENIDTAKACIEWYSWRWTVEEVFKILKKEGYNIEASELEYASSIRKQSLMIMEVCIKLFLMRLAYAEPEQEIEASSCFTMQEQEVLEHYIIKLEGKTDKQKNPHKEKKLKRYVWVIARLGGWKGYESKRHPGITTLWTGLGRFKDAMEGWLLTKDVSTR